jgi:hypothetical protein
MITDLQFVQAWLSMVQVSTGDGWATDVLRPLLAAGEHTRSDDTAD